MNPFRWLGVSYRPAPQTNSFLNRAETHSSNCVVGIRRSDFSFIVEKLKEQGKIHDLKEILANYFAAIDVHQEEDDPASGHMNIMLFEIEIPGRELSEHKKTLISPVLTTGNCERMSKLPSLDTFRNFLFNPSFEGKASLIGVKQLDFTIP